LLPEEQEQLTSLQNQLWDNGRIGSWMNREDTECRCYQTSKYMMYLWDLKSVHPSERFKEVSWAFRILAFLGAPDGFKVTWWRFPADRVVEAGKFPTRAEVNGGWAYRGKPAVWLFREQEWDRVLIHECVHALDWDIIPASSVRTCLQESLDDEANLVDAIFEAATELNAEWLWCIIHSPVDDDTGKTWMKQREWQIYQAGAIIARRPEHWSEDTSVFAYYVLKAVLALDTFDFIYGWLTGTSDTDTWCELWRASKKAIIHKADMLKDTVNKELCTRMTNPVLDI